MRRILNVLVSALFAGAALVLFVGLVADIVAHVGDASGDISSKAGVELFLVAVIGIIFTRWAFVLAHRGRGAV